MQVTINKSTAKGIVKAPASKSMAHRYIVCAGLSKGESTVTNVDFSEDIKATLNCIESLGAKVEKGDNYAKVTGVIEYPTEVIFNCNESGSTMRFFMGIAMGLGIKAKFYGSKTLLSRPFSIYEEIIKNVGGTFERHEDYIYVDAKLKPNTFMIQANISSQFISGLLFSLPLLNGDSKIELIPPVESRSYINLTLEALDSFGVKVSWDTDTLLYVKGNREYKPKTIEVEGDYSNAAFLDAFNYLGGNVQVTGLKETSLQGDKVYKEYLEKLKKENATLDISDCPDLGPVLMAMAAALNGAKFVGTKRLKIKESDRGSVMCAELSKFGIESKIYENEIEIIKGELNAPTEVLSGHNDHRIVMSLSLLLSKTGGKIDEAEAVRKSYPGFFEDIKKLGIEVL